MLWSTEEVDLLVKLRKDEGRTLVAGGKIILRAISEAKVLFRYTGVQRHFLSLRPSP